MLMICQAVDEETANKSDLSADLSKLFCRRLDITQALYSYPSCSLPSIAKHEPFSYAAILSAFNDAQKLFADSKSLEQRLKGGGFDHIKTAVKAFIIDLEFFMS